MLIGRKPEIRELDKICRQEASAFISVYGRRRIGKTYLIRTLFTEQRSDCVFFEFTGAEKGDNEDQLENFTDSLYAWFRVTPEAPFTKWSSAFNTLKRCLDQALQENGSSRKAVVFLDELPWVDRNDKHGYLGAIGHFWETYAQPRKNVVLIVCGSNASWIKRKVFENSEGPLYKRVTKKIPLKPFDLKMTAEFLKHQGFDLDAKTVMETYMIFGGVAKYLSYLDPEKSIYQNIQAIFFHQDGLMFDEYEELFKSLYRDKAPLYKQIMDTLCDQPSGLTLQEILQKSGVGGGTSFYAAVEDLEECGFVQSVSRIGHAVKNRKIMVSDPYSLFYSRWLKDYSRNSLSNLQDDFWPQEVQKQRYAIWSGYAFESACMNNVHLYARARGISGIIESVSYWNHTGEEGESGTQIDMLVKYGDVYDIVECKFYAGDFEPDNNDAKNIQNKIAMFRKHGLSKKRAEIKLVFLTSYGVRNNKVFNSLNVSCVLSLEDLLA